MNIKYANELIQNMVLVNPKKCVYQFVLDQDDSNDTKIIQYFIIHILGLYIKLNSFVAHMFYAWSFSHNTLLPIFIKQKRFLSLNEYTNVFSCRDGNSNKNRT